MKSLVSVVVPVLNREKLIKRCLDSIVNQTYRPLELIVVDNGSSDNTLAEINSWKTGIESSGLNVRIFNEPEKGACAARQKGLENVTGEFVIFFDSDDVMHADLIEKAMEAFHEFPETEVVCWPSCIHLLDGSRKIPPFIPDKPIEGHLIHTLFRPQGTLFKTRFIKKIGGWSKTVPVWNDFELGLRILLHNGKIARVNSVLADIYAQEESITGKNFSSKQGFWENTLDIMEEETLASDHPEKERISDILDYRRVILAAHYYREKNKTAAEDLLKRAIRNKSFARKQILRFSYHYTKAGMRGVWRIIRGML